MEFLKSDIIWKDTIKRNWFLTFYNFESLTYNDSNEYKKIGSYFELFRKLKLDDHHVIKVIDYMFDLNENKLNSVQLKLEGIYKKFRYYLPQLMKEVRHFKPEDFIEINGRLVITQKQVNLYINERSNNLRRIYIASKVIEAYNSRKFYKFLRAKKTCHLDRPKDYEPYYLLLSLCDPLFYDSLLIREKIINETVNRYNSTEFDYTYGSNVNKVIRIGEILLEKLHKQSGFFKSDDSYTRYSQDNVWLLSRIYMGDFDNPFPLILLTISKVCSLVGLGDYISLYCNYMLVENEDKKIYKLYGRNYKLKCDLFIEKDSHSIFELKGENGFDVARLENIFYSSASLNKRNKVRTSKINYSVKYKHMIAYNHGRIHSQLSFVGKDIDKKLISNIIKLVYEKELLPHTINLFNKCLFEDVIEEFGNGFTLSLKRLFSMDKCNSLFENMLEFDYIEDFDRELIGRILCTNTSYGVITNVMVDKSGVRWCCVYSNEYGDQFIPDYCKGCSKHVLGILLNDDKLGKYFKSYKLGKFKAI
ncbi:hypothetical protein DAPK24_042650 [Pichia kluyveri]|uniref:Uncharacterized protein n=1 Tax=Pichia kluyveri TaxID=36015 RepID=A0AAV5R9A3_PICKL|nr:hypothetical protein DAPK24_042650 [Pichia kluyveri]